MTTTDIASADALRELFASRYSCRGFLPDPVPVEIVQQILEMAQRSASWSNTQPWHTTVLAGDETKRFSEHLLAAAIAEQGTSDLPPPGRYEGEFQARRRASGFALYDSLNIAYDDINARKNQMLENYRLFGAPHVAIISSEASVGPYGYIDTGAYLTGFLLAATSLGVATIAQAAIGMHANVVHEFLGIPESQHVVCGVSFGYADVNHPANAFRTERAPLHEVADLRGF